MRALASRGGKAKRRKEDTQPRTVTHWDGTPERHVPYHPPLSIGRPERDRLVEVCYRARHVVLVVAALARLMYALAKLGSSAIAWP